MSAASTVDRRWAGRLVLVVLAAWLVPTTALAQRLVAVAPLATLGSEDTSQGAQAVTAQLERAVAGLPGTTAMTAAQVAAVLKRAKRQGPAGCDGELACVADLGRVVGAAVLITGQLGGLGEARVVYLSAVDTASGKELGSTTWSTGEGDSAAAAVVRLLAPAQYVGKLQLRLSVPSATVYVNGVKLPPSAGGAHVLPVGTHALRVTHPEARDFVRFVDLRFGETTEVEVTLTPLPVVQREVTERRKSPGSERSGQRRWFGSWWAVAGGAALLAAVAGTVTYVLADDFSPDVTLP